jgi:hypothetical protein
MQILISIPDYPKHGIFRGYYSTKVLQLGRETVLKDRIDLLSEKYLLQSDGPCSSLVSTQTFEEFGISRHLLDGIKEWEVDFYLFEDLHYIL